MKNNKIWYLGYVVGFCSLIAAFVFKFNEVIEIMLTFVFAISASISRVRIMHSKMMEKDINYKINVNDERNEKIKDKVNAAMASILMLLMRIIAIVCLSIQSYLPAALLGISVGCSLLMMFFINKYYEQKY